MIRFIVFVLIVSLPLAAQEFTVAATSSLNGFLDGCTCTANPKNGLAIRAYFLNELRKKNKNVLLVDSGDLLSPDAIHLKEAVVVDGKKFDRPIKEPFIFEIYRTLKYDALVMGDQDLSKGVDYFLSEAKTLPYVNATITVQGQSFGKPYLLKTVNGVTIAIIGITGDTAFKYQRKEIKDIAGIIDAFSALPQLIKSARAEKADVVLVLSHSGYDRDVEYIKKIPGIDIVVSGHDQYLPVKDPEAAYDKEEVDTTLVAINDKYVLSTGQNGNRVGIGSFVYENGSVKMKKYSLQNFHYGTAMEKKQYDPAVKAQIEASVQKEMKMYEKRRVEIK